MRKLLLKLFIGLAAVPAQAQTVPNAGSILQQIERGQEQQQMLPRKKPAELIAPPELKAPAGLSVTVREFRFSGNTLLSAEKLAPAVAPFLNRPLDFNGLNKAAAAVAEIYHQAGWIVRTYLPQQDIKEGIVTIQIVEAVFGGTHINGEVPPRISREQIMRIFEAQQKIGDPLSADALDRALLLADDLPGVTVSGSLREGAKERETDIDVKLGDEPLAAGEAGIDNTGSRSTGTARLTANINLNSSFKHGDLVSANLIHTQGSDYLRVDGNVPVGSNGLRTGINGSHLSYNLVAPEFSALNAGGTSDTIGLEATYPIIRSRLKNLYLNVNADNKAFDNQSSGATTTHYKEDVITVALDGNLFDSLWGGGANSANLTLVDGNLNLNGSPNQAADATTTQTAGHYDKLRFAATRQQVITETVSLFGALSGQVTHKNLDSSEKFYLGGSGGVRAYPSNEGGGSEGKLLNLELRYRLPQGYNFTEFYDFGHITINPDNHFAGASTLNDYSLKGFGMSLAWQSEKGPSVKATWSHRLGNNPNPTNTGNDQDGSLLKNRFWLTASIPFTVNGSSAAASTLSSNAAPQTFNAPPQAVRNEPVEPPAMQPKPFNKPEPSVTEAAKQAVVAKPQAIPATPQQVRDEPVTLPETQPKAYATVAVSVSLDRPATKQLVGLIKVSVPNNLRSFSFPLPAEVASSTKALRVHSGKPGKRVPSWLKFNQKTRTFAAASVPKDALPTQLVVTADGISTTIAISQQN